ncbi:hypothetical protein NDA01_29550 [Trichocoleus desertorum AS-A10]|uniref:hypothetical protein n=1 Tax=Trichocoleus desertorum TaxID=1481672 RepID=UPI003297E7C7
MPFESVPGTLLNYYLINFDALGNERNEPDGSKLSQTVLEVLSQEPITDVFIFSHGWQGDIPAARNQYDRWIKAMASNTADIEKIKQLRPGFKALLIGLHWPSLPWGNELIEVGSEAEAVEALTACYAERVSNSEPAKSALKTIFSEALSDLEPDELSGETIEAYRVLNQEAGLGSEGVTAAPGDDREAFDPESIYKESEVETEIIGDGADFGLLDGGSFVLSRVLSPLRTLSYWKMKARARQFGESAGFELLTTLQKATSEQVRFHLVGHSFGCIVMSATLAGPKVQGVLPRPVNSLSLIQGALSLWAYCSDIPKARGTAGYFYPVIRDGKVSGPIITTLSEYDSAVGVLYPLASGVAMSSASFEVFPKYGAIGAFGIQGDGISLNPLQMLSCDRDYDFKSGQIYNLGSSQYICKIPPDAGLGGAHNAIDEPEVAHAVWSAAMSI